MFETGNSGNLLIETVTKIGPNVAQEAAYCQYLGDQVCPKIYHIGIDIYTMEKLLEVPRDKDLLRRMENLLEYKVWNRPALPSSNEVDWRIKLQKFGIEVPKWLKTSSPCLCHGDPTASNALSRNGGRYGRYIIIGDPRPPRDFIPQCRETDVGRLLQSYFGWEVAAYNCSQVIFDKPKYWSDESLFWCGAAAARIEYLERSRSSRENILNWCQVVRRICGV